jgi:hypothetical protein
MCSSESHRVNSSLRLHPLTSRQETSFSVVPCRCLSRLFPFHHLPLPPRPLNYRHRSFSLFRCHVLLLGWPMGLSQTLTIKRSLIGPFSFLFQVNLRFHLHHRSLQTWKHLQHHFNRFMWNQIYSLPSSSCRLYLGSWLYSLRNSKDLYRYKYKLLRTHINLHTISVGIQAEQTW